MYCRCDDVILLTSWHVLLSNTASPTGFKLPSKWTMSLQSNVSPNGECLERDTFNTTIKSSFRDEDSSFWTSVASCSVSGRSVLYRGIFIICQKCFLFFLTLLSEPDNIGDSITSTSVWTPSALSLLHRLRIPGSLLPATILGSQDFLSFGIFSDILIWMSSVSRDTDSPDSKTSLLSASSESFRYADPSIENLESRSEFWSDLTFLTEPSDWEWILGRELVFTRVKSGSPSVLQSESENRGSEKKKFLII